MSTSGTVKVEKATSNLLIGPDWTMNIEICDSINSDLWQAKEVTKAIKKRLQHRNPKVQFLALTLLETMIKNCGDYVHSQVVEREILQQMVKIVKEKADMQVRDKILVLLDSWQEAFGGPGCNYPQYYWAYMDLKRAGVEFPQRPRDSALIFTPPGSLSGPVSTYPQVRYGMPSSSAMRLDEAMASDTGNLSLPDLNSMQHVMELLREMLQAVHPNDQEAVKDELIVDLVNQCRTNQKKLMELVTSTGDEELLGQGLSLNDSLQSLLARHNAIVSGSPLRIEAPESAKSIPLPAARVAPIPVADSRDNYEEEEDDEFAQLARRSRPATAQSISASETLPNYRDAMTASPATSTSEVSSSLPSNALVPTDLPAPVRTFTKEEDMIQFLSITLSANPSPSQTPDAHSSHQNESPALASSTGELHSQSSLPSLGNQGYAPSNGYVAAWAQHTVSQRQSQSPPSESLSPPQAPFQSQHLVPQYSYPPPPWTASVNSNPNPFMSNTYQYPGQSIVPATNASLQDSRPLQHYNSYGRSNFSSTGEAQMSGNQRHGSGTSPKPYVPSHRLFEDLMDMRNTDERVKVRTQTSLSGAQPSNPGQGMIRGKK